MEPRTYYIQTRTAHGWHRLHPQNYESLKEAELGIERFIDNMWFELGETLPTGIFRIVRYKNRKEHTE